MNNLLDKLARAISRIPDESLDTDSKAQRVLQELQTHLTSTTTKEAMATKTPGFVLDVVVKELKDTVVKLHPKPKPAATAHIAKFQVAVAALPNKPVVKVTPEFRSQIQQLVSTHSYEVATLKARVVNAEAASSKLVHLLSHI